MSDASPPVEDPEEHLNDDPESLRQRVEESLAGLVPEVFKRTLEAGLGTLSRADTRKVLRRVKDLGVPKDVAHYFLVQVDDTKNALLRVFAREVREFLEHTDLADDMRKVLTSVSLEVSTRVRFVPNESGTGIRPEVDSSVSSTDIKLENTAPPTSDEEE